MVHSLSVYNLTKISEHLPLYSYINFFEWNPNTVIKFGKRKYHVLSCKCAFRISNKTCKSWDVSSVYYAASLPWLQIRITWRDFLKYDAYWRSNLACWRQVHKEEHYPTFPLWTVFQGNQTALAYLKKKKKVFLYKIILDNIWRRNNTIRKSPFCNP